ncbi:MAG: lipopolysaccharide biosynthesis protein [Bacteroides sp.]|nr:lipopolysaccharide biosynthesis protein [Bacteroides sp.]MCM1412879.1 lipopolysaccharide biosynthesis protein [Bacteroides sp.]MCM1471548.1 lipopolysaccharide biosynthesis protein [Bacteroides sp.]
MKMRVARTLKWNVIDKFSTQLLYGVTGVVLARELSQADFGLVGAILVFQAFATMFVDGGFSYALIQRKEPADRDYSTVMWFNIAMSVVLYAILFLCAPLIADCFEGDQRLIPLSRVMFFSFVINACSSVQQSRLLKRMEAKSVAVSNSLGLFVAAVVGVALAVNGFGPWALVWQTITLAVVKSMLLWGLSGWRPQFYFSWHVLRSFARVGGGMFCSSFLNVLFQNIYSFFIGNRVGLVSLGYYTQADKWSKMGIASLSQVLSSSFLPALSSYQDNPERFAATTSKMNRFTSYLTFPAMVMLMVMARPIFHALFGEKWDPAIFLFQLLLFRGIFTTLGMLYNNYVIAVGKSRLVLVAEFVRDGTALAAIFITLPFIAMTFPDDPTYGVAIFIWGQVAAAILAWVYMLVVAAKISWHKPWDFLVDSVPYATLSIVAAAAMILVGTLVDNPWIEIALQLTVGTAVYMGIAAALGSVVQKDVVAYFMKRKNEK